MQILSRRTLLYAEGADQQLDRPAHVRAGSGCCFVELESTAAGDKPPPYIAVVQDDAHFLALVDVTTGSTRALTLPAGPGGLRQFDSRRGNKKQKMDLEACVWLDGRAVLFGSGSTDERERVLYVDVKTGAVETRDMHAMYEELRAHPLMTDAELNIEGVVKIDDGLRLFQRGNGL